jgi:hypothetical protein
MFSKSHEQDLADIKNATKELSERLQTVVERLDKLIEAQAAAPAAAPAAAGDAAAEPAGKKQRKRQARAPAAGESSPGRKGTKAERRKDGRTKREVRAAQEPVDVTAEAADNGKATDGEAEQAAESASGSEPKEE